MNQNEAPTPFQKQLLSREETVSGVVIGGEGRFYGRLFYEGRPQCQQICGDSDADVIAQGREQFADIKRQCGAAFYEVFPNREKSAWEIRIYD